jgi:hypothetical protein
MTARGEIPVVPRGSTPKPKWRRGADPAEDMDCIHGAMQRRAGVSARGGWAGWFCADSMCKPVWADADYIVRRALNDWVAGGPALGGGPDAPPF